MTLSYTLNVEKIEWNPEKNEWLKQERGVQFEDVLVAVEEDRVIDIVSHENQKKYPGQKILLVVIKGYVYKVPCIVDDQKWFLKTMYPSRTATKKYLKARGE